MYGEQNSRKKRGEVCSSSLFAVVSPLVASVFLLSYEVSALLAPNCGKKLKSWLMLNTNNFMKALDLKKALKIPRMLGHLRLKVVPFVLLCGTVAEHLRIRPRTTFGRTEIGRLLPPP